MGFRRFFSPVGGGYGRTSNLGGTRRCPLGSEKLEVVGSIPIGGYNLYIGFIFFYLVKAHVQTFSLYLKIDSDPK